MEREKRTAPPRHGDKQPVSAKWRERERAGKAHGRGKVSVTGREPISATKPAISLGEALSVSASSLTLRLTGVGHGAAAGCCRLADGIAGAIAVKVW